MKKWLLILLGLLLPFFSCVRETPERGGDGIPFPEGEKMTVNFSVYGDIPGDGPSRALSEKEELENLYIAVFGSSGYLKEYVQATLTEKVDTVWHFSVTLTLSDSPRILHFIGNGPETLPFGYVDAVMPSLLSEREKGAYWQMKKLDGIRARKSTTEYTDAAGNRVYPGDYIDKDAKKIINGKGYIPDDETAAAFVAIPMVRNWAKIVVTGENPDSSYFTPYSYAVVNVPSRGTVVPHCAATGFIANYHTLGFDDLEGMHYAANLPPGTTFNESVPTAEDFVNCTGGVAAAGTSSGVYLYERPVPSSSIPPTYIIIFGHYRNPDDLEHEGDYFYKVDLMVDADYYPVFRNFKYQVIIRKILSQGHHTPVAAAAAAGSADVSADITTSHLTDISDGHGRLVIQPWISRTFSEAQTDNVLFHAYLMSDIYHETVDMNAASVTVEKLPMAYGSEDLITELSIDPPSTEQGSVGWRTIHFSTHDPGTTIRSQTIRVTGRHEFGRLYRDIVITVQPIQPMKVECAAKRIAAEQGTPQIVHISIPDGLVQSMFPLLFNIEPEDRTLSPDGSMANNNLPVESGPSISEHESYAGKPSYHFVYTLSWEEYRTLTLVQDDDDNYWRTFTCYFKSNRRESATTVWVTNEYFETASDSFTNYRSSMTFRNLNFTDAIPLAEDATVSVQFTVDEDPDLDYPADYPMIQIRPQGMIPVSEELIPGPVSGTWVFKPEAASVTLSFVTITDDGDLQLELSAEEYETKTLRTHHFSHVGLINGHQLTNTSSWSNVVCGRVNSDANKTVLFGYCDDPQALNVPVTVTGPDGELLIQANAKTTRAGLYATKPSAFPYAPTGPRGQYGLSTYHEIEFKTTSSKNYNPVEFTLSAPGYVVEHIRTGRLNGNIYTQQLTTGNVIKPGNSYGFTVDNPQFTYPMETKSYPHNMTVSFSNIADIRSAYPAGIMIPAGESCTVSVESTRNDCYPCYIEFTIQARVNWSGARRNLCPASGTTDAGTFEAYPGNDTQYLWFIPEHTHSASITLTAKEDSPICISGMVLKTYRGSFYD